MILDRCSRVSQFAHQETSSRQQSHQADQFGRVSWTRIDAAGTIAGAQQVGAPLCGNLLSTYLFSRLTEVPTDALIGMRALTTLSLKVKNYIF